jgi:hypothetical protein
MSSKDKKSMSEEDYLKKHLEDLESKGSKTNATSNEIPYLATHTESSRVSDLNFFNFDVKELPCGRFYPTGTVLMVRPAQVKEIQAYSMVDDNNFYDIVEKMNDMIQSCVRLKYPDGRVTSFIDLKDQDRLYVTFLIRELTFQKGSSLGVLAKCTCGEETQLELIRKNFSFHEFDEKLNRFFDHTEKCFRFRTTNNKEFSLTPPNIGMQKAFTEYIVKENSEKRAPNLSFLKIIPFMLGGRSSITIDGIKSKLMEFENMDDISFQFLNAAVGKMTFGIKELKTNCHSCGQEVRTDMQFPSAASGIFVIQNAFDAYIKE